MGKLGELPFYIFYIKMRHDPSSKTFVFVFIQDVDKMRMALYRFLTTLMNTTLSNISKIMFLIHHTRIDLIRNPNIVFI